MPAHAMTQTANTDFIAAMALAGHDWRDGAYGLPVLAGASASFECEVETWHDAGTHRIFIGCVLHSKPGAAAPLVYCNRAFARVSAY